MKLIRTASMAVLLVVVLVIPAVDSGNAAEKHGIAGIVAALMSPLAFFDQRSPGERGAGALLSTKPDRMADNAGPHERVLSTVREREPSLGDAPQADGAIPAAYNPALAGFPDVTNDGANPGAESLPGAAAPITGNGDGFNNPLAGSSFPGSSFQNAPNDFEIVRPPAAVSAVPEPSTWAMLILGFLAVGGALRGMRKRQAIRDQALRA